MKRRYRPTQLHEGQTPDFTMAVGDIQANIMYHDIYLDNAQDNIEVPIAGTSIYIAQFAYDDNQSLKKIPSTSKEVGFASISLNGNNGTPIELTKGISYEFNIPFEVVYLSNTAQPNKMIRIYYSSNTTIRPFSSEIQLVGEVASTLAIVADVTVNNTSPLIMSANSARKSVMIQNPPTNTHAVRIANTSANATASKGIYLAVGGNLVLDYTGALYAYSAGAQNIIVQELE